QVHRRLSRRTPGGDAAPGAQRGRRYRSPVRFRPVPRAAPSEPERLREHDLPDNTRAGCLLRVSLAHDNAGAWGNGAQQSPESGSGLQFLINTGNTGTVTEIPVPLN